jgi:hypothetical protein
MAQYHLIVDRSINLILSNLHFYCILKKNKFNVHVHIINSIQKLNDVLLNINGIVIFLLHGNEYGMLINNNMVYASDIQFINTVNTIILASCYSGRNQESIAYMLQQLYPNIEIIATTSIITVHDICINETKNITFGEYTSNMDDSSKNKEKNISNEGFPYFTCILVCILTVYIVNLLPI